MYGTARVVYPGDPAWPALAAELPSLPGARQIFDLAVEFAQTSCGMSVPLLDHVGERDALKTWAEDKGPEGLAAYWSERNAESLDGLPTGIAAGAG